MNLSFSREPAAPKKRRLHKVGETASVAAETPAAGEPQQTAVPPAGERRVEEVMEETAPSPVRAAAPPVTEYHVEEVAEEAAPSPARAANPPAAEHHREERPLAAARLPQASPRRPWRSLQPCGAAASLAPPALWKKISSGSFRRIFQKQKIKGEGKPRLTLQQSPTPFSSSWVVGRCLLRPPPEASLPPREEHSSLSRPSCRGQPWSGARCVLPYRRQSPPPPRRVGSG